MKEKQHHNDHHHPDHSKLLTRLNRASGQMGGVKKMIEEGKYCIDIITQIKAIKSALSSIELKIMQDHAKHCLKDAVLSGNKKELDLKIDEILELYKKIV